jgi:hypothetical protein
MANCATCQAENTASAKKCSSCGAAFDKAAPARVRSPNHLIGSTDQASLPIARLVAFVVGLFAILGSVGAALLFEGKVNYGTANSSAKFFGKYAPTHLPWKFWVGFDKMPWKVKGLQLILILAFVAVVYGCLVAASNNGPLLRACCFASAVLLVIQLVWYVAVLKNDPQFKQDSTTLFASLLGAAALSIVAVLLPSRVTDQ